MEIEFEYEGRKYKIRIDRTFLEKYKEKGVDYTIELYGNTILVSEKKMRNRN